jgi:hypothetical protein
MTKRRTFVALSALAASLIPFKQVLGQTGQSITPETTPSTKETTSSQTVEILFVQTAEDLKVDPDAQTLRLVKVNPQTLYFSDRPNRVAGHLTMAAYMDEWQWSEGANDFASDPPNATLSVYEQGNPINTLTVVEISNPIIDGNDLIYTYSLIEGTMPEAGGQTALFIDTVGVGGGVGPGYHGVGAGTRGVGLTGGYGGPAR